MGIIFDIIIVLILVTSIYYGYKKGIIDVGYKLVAMILSLLVSVILFMPITQFIINNTEIDEKIEEIILKNAISKAEKNDEQLEGIDSYVQKYAKDLAVGTQNVMVEASAKPIAVNIIRIGVMILLFTITRVVLVILKMCTNIIAKIPILKQCNEIIGFVYGVLRGVLIVYGILAVLFFIVSMTEATVINVAIDSSYITKFLYNNNLLMKLW